jgi:hypothetical protein
MIRPSPACLIGPSPSARGAFVLFEEEKEARSCVCGDATTAHSVTHSLLSSFGRESHLQGHTPRVAVGTEIMSTCTCLF